MRKWLLALAGVWIVAAAWAVPVDEKHLVRPGEGIGVIRLGMTVPEVHAAMEAWGSEPLVRGASGGPGAWVDEKAGAIIEGYQTDSMGRGRYGNVMKIFYVKNRVAQIAVQSVAYVTTKGASKRMNSGEWRQRHPSLRSLSSVESWGGKIRAYDSESQGLAVTFNLLSGTREAMSAQEVLVHASGAPLLVESPRPATTKAAPKPEPGTGVVPDSKPDPAAGENPPSGEVAAAR